MTTIYADTRIPHIRPRPLLADHRSDEGIEDGMLVAALSAGLTGVYLARRGKWPTQMFGHPADFVLGSTFAPAYG